MYLENEKIVKPPLEGFLRINSICELFDVEKSTVYSWIKKGKLSKGFKLGARVRAWKRSEIEKLLETLPVPITEETAEAA